MSMEKNEARYRVIGMDCAKDAAEVERAVARLPAVRDVRVSSASHILTFTSAGAPAPEREVTGAVEALGYRLEPLGSAGSDDDIPAHMSPGYRRALWIVVGLNVGYGVVEMIGGFLVGSQALKADALDFIGDGLITFMGLLAIGWSLLWRARAAMIQGIFLGVLGLGVIANTIYQLATRQPPEAGMMGVLGMVALAVNVAAAAVLMPHRSGDSNVRAVWLFSRNDAIGNLAVVIAAGLVALTGSALPDIVVAGIIALLFLHSSLSIVRDARRDMSGLTASARSGA
jgi:Co/Zn/Cd efflux system component/copper chaperone CopZ